VEIAWQPHSLAGEKPFLWSLQAFARPQIQIAHHKSSTIPSSRQFIVATRSLAIDSRSWLERAQTPGLRIRLRGWNSQYRRLVGRSFPGADLLAMRLPGWAETAAARIPRRTGVEEAIEMEANCPQIGQQSKKATGEEDGEANAGASQGHPAQSTRVRGPPSASQGLAMASRMLSDVAVAFPKTHTQHNRCLRHDPERLRQ
jgi:hypothetical protein